MNTVEEFRDSLFVLPEDLVLSPVLQLPKAIRSMMDHKDTDYAMTRRYARFGTKIISKEAGLLLEQFRTPRKLVDGIIAFSDALEAEAMPVLDSASTMLFALVEEDCLTIEGSEQALATKPSLEPGAKFRDFEVVQCCQLLEDTEVYKVQDDEGGAFALKIVRPSHANESMATLFMREQKILERLEGTSAPKFREGGVVDDRPYMIMEWVEGVPLDQLTVLHQKKGAVELGGAELAYVQSQKMSLASNLISAYADLHGKGCLHGDVHTRNVLVLTDQSVRIIDFGYGRFMDDPEPAPPRAGVTQFYEPELAMAYLEGTPPPVSNVLGEQYSVAVMVHEMLGTEYIAKGRYLPLSIDYIEQLKEIVTYPALPLTSYFDRFEPRIDAAIERALSKRPEDRFSSIQEFHDAFVGRSRATTEIDDQRSDKVNIRLGSQANRPAGQFIRQFVYWCDPEESWFDIAFRRQPSCSIKVGGAGVAYSLYHLATRFGSSDLLSLADLWICKTKAHLGDERAFYGTEIDMTFDNVGRVAPLHTASGVHMVQALISDAMGDMENCYRSLERFILTAAGAPCANLDLTIGRSGVLLTCAIALEHFGKSSPLDLSPIRALGEVTLKGIWDEIAEMGAIQDAKEVDNLGLAHGWAGLCYGALRWHAAAGTEPIEAIRDRLEELAEFGTPYNKGIRFPYAVGHDEWSTGWCNGHAGWVQLWTEAWRAYQDDRYLALAEGSASSTWSDRNGIASLCCGSAGKGYALIEMYNATKDPRWLKRAEQIGKDGLAAYPTGYSLYKSMGGVVALVADLTQPEYACQPYFGRES